MLCIIFIHYSTKKSVSKIFLTGETSTARYTVARSQNEIIGIHPTYPIRVLRFE